VAQTTHQIYVDNRSPSITFTSPSSDSWINGTYRFDLIISDDGYLGNISDRAGSGLGCSFTGLPTVYRFYQITPTTYYCLVDTAVVNDGPKDHSCKRD